MWDAGKGVQWLLNNRHNRSVDTAILEVPPHGSSSSGGEDDAQSDDPGAPEVKDDVSIAPAPAKLEDEEQSDDATPHPGQFRYWNLSDPRGV